MKTTKNEKCFLRLLLACQKGNDSGLTSTWTGNDADGMAYSVMIKNLAKKKYITFVRG